MGKQLYLGASFQPSKSDWETFLRLALDDLLELFSPVGWCPNESHYPLTVTEESVDYRTSDGLSGQIRVGTLGTGSLPFFRIGRSRPRWLKFFFGWPAGQKNKS